MFTPGNPLLSYHSIDTYSAGCQNYHVSGVTAGAWPAANLAIYVPIQVTHTVVARKLWVGCGSTGTGNLDVGVYNAAGTQVIAATETAHPAATNEFVFDVTDTTITPGIYYMGLSSSNNTDTFARDNDAAPISASMGVLTEALGSVTLPATATWVVDNTLAYYPVCGILLETTVA